MSPYGVRSVYYNDLHIGLDPDDQYNYHLDMDNQYKQ